MNILAQKIAHKCVFRDILQFAPKQRKFNTFHSPYSKELIQQCYQHSANSTVLQNSTVFISYCFQYSPCVIISRLQHARRTYTAKILAQPNRNSTDISAVSARFSISEFETVKLSHTRRNCLTQLQFISAVCDAFAHTSYSYFLFTEKSQV